MEGSVRHSSSDDYSERIESTRELELLTVLEEGLKTSPSHVSAAFSNQSFISKIKIIILQQALFVF